MIILKVICVLVLINALSATETSNEEETHKHPYGSPLSIMRFTTNHSVTVDFDAIDKLFLNPEVVNRKIVVISIIGAYRKGKSFFLDYCLRYMYANYKSVNFLNNSLETASNWVGEVEKPLTGFSWKSGPDRHTSGVVAWSDVFLHEAQIDNNFEKIAIIIMDTQGLFDSKTNPTDNPKIFALGTLISSMQIFNLNDVVQEDQLEYLQMATDYAKFTTNSNSSQSHKPFQDLLILMRDWQHNNIYSYGLQGGDLYLANVLKIDDDQSPDLKSVRQYVRTSFDDVHCYLMPHPGLSIVGDKSYDGRFSKLEANFQKHLIKLIEWLLAPDNLKKKRVLNSEVIGRDFNEFVKAYFRKFQSPEALKIQSLYETTIERQLANFVEASLNLYKAEISKFQPNFKSANFSKELYTAYKNAKDMAIIKYIDEKKMGSLTHEKNFRKELEKEIDLFGRQWSDNMMDTYKKMFEVAKENERKIQEMKDKAETDFQAEKARLAAEKVKLEQEIAEREVKLRANLELKENEKQAAIEKAKIANEVLRKENENRLNKLISEQEVERARIKKQAEESSKKAQSALKRLKQKQVSQQVAFELQIHLDREERQKFAEQQAKERAQERSLAQSVLNTRTAKWKEEMELLRLQVAAQTRECTDMLESSGEEEESSGEEEESSGEEEDVEVDLAHIVIIDSNS